jgi:hypothetical protein
MRLTEMRWCGFAGKWGRKRRGFIKILFAKYFAIELWVVGGDGFAVERFEGWVI